MKKIISIILTCAILATSFSMTFVTSGVLAEESPAQSTELVTKNGTLMFEAEDIEFNKDNMALAKGSNMSNGKGVSVLSDDKNTPAKDAEPDMDLSFTADVTGQYAIWVRNTKRPSSGQSCWFKVSDGGYSYVELNGSEEVFGWTKLGSLYVEAGQVGIARLIRRQRFSVVYDRFIITNNKFFIPTDDNLDTSTICEMIMPSDEYPTPTITPKPEHPRVLFRAKDIPEIKKNLTAPQNAAAYNAWQALLNVELDAKLPPPRSGSTNYSSNTITRIEARAFDYAINGNVENGKMAVQAINDYFDTVVWSSDSLNYRKRGQVLYTAAEVYDWCYDLMTDEERKHLIAQCEVMATDLDIGYPPKNQGAVCGHGGENSLLRDLLAVGIATYDERPDIYNYVAGRILSEFVVTRNYWYTAHNHHQGNSYGDYRGSCEVWANILFEAMSDVRPFSDDQQYMPYEWIYSRRPDGQALRDGDEYNESGYSGIYWRSWNTTMALISGLYDNDYVKRELLKSNKNLETFSTQYSMNTAVQVLVLNNPYNNGKPSSQLPLTKYFASPDGMMIARTGWNNGKDAPDVLAMMKISEVSGANHDHLDAGSFQLYYKGILASESGDYDDGYGTAHHINYAKRSVAHNVLTIYDPNEKMTMSGSKLVANDGGQRAPQLGVEPGTMELWMSGEYERAKVLAHAFGPDPVKPEYTFIKGDITNAYSDKVDEVLRSMLFMPLEDEDHPAVMIVMDKVDAKDPTFKKSWLLHTQEEPEVIGNKTIVTRTEEGYNGRMVVETLLPKEANIEKIGGEGKESWVDGKNYPSKVNHPITNDSEAKGWGRIEVSPAKAADTDYFLNVMTVSDADTTAPDLESTLLETDEYCGVKIADRVAVFVKGKDTINKKVTIELGEGEHKVFVAGLRSGTWTGENGEKALVTEEGQVAYFTSTSSTLTLSRKSPNTGGEEIEPVYTTEDPIGVRINNAYIYSDVDPVLIDGRTLLPMRALLENMNAEVSFDEATATATAVSPSHTVSITENSKTAYVDGQAVELDVPAMIIDGRFVIPVRFVAESLDAVVEWDEFAKVVYITISTSGKPVKPGVQKEGVATIKSCVSSSVGDDDRGENSYDGDESTVWAVNGLGEPIVYQFDKEYELDSVYILLNKATDRVAYFDIEYSLDGVNYTKIGSYKNDQTKNGEVFKFPTPVKAKYIKYIANGNNTSEWHAIKEIEFRIKK